MTAAARAGSMKCSPSLDGAHVARRPHGIPLALPYNHDPAWPDWIIDHAQGVSEVYLPIHIRYGPTARPWAGPADLHAYHQELRPLARALERVEVRANLVINLPVWTGGRDGIPSEVGRMVQLFGPRMSVTLTDFPLARELRAAFPSLPLSVSSGAQIATARQARYWVDGVGVDSIVVSREINRRPQAIALVKAQGRGPGGLGIKVVLDDACLPECPSLVSHMALMGQCDHAAGRGACMMSAERIDRPWLVAQKDLVPALLHRYVGLVDVAKVEGRARSLAEIARKRALYLEGESWEHPQGHYIEPPQAQAWIEACDRICEDCGWCAGSFRIPTAPEAAAAP